jgi:ketosteroid isomerase-like protein
VAAWRSYDPGEIKALFTEEVVYRPLPYDEPLRGREAVAKAWIADPDPPGSWTADYRAVAVTGDVGVGQGITRYKAGGRRPEREYANVFILRFDERGRCREYVEWWVKQPARSSSR